MSTPQLSDQPIVTAMSGGVDSSVAAALMAEQGLPIVGVSMQVWDYRRNGGCESRATCCSPDDFTDARQVAAKIGIPYYVFDLEEKFNKEVIQKFIDSYHEGETPNPCIDCNNKVKFRELRSRALSLGASGVATGHYARIEARGDGFHLLRGKDRAKDQSYFLYGLSQEELGLTYFPVGDFTKEEVRELARERGLITANKPESQDICFVSGTVEEFMSRHGKTRPPGNIVTRDGKILGRHGGIHTYTVGQRKGLGVGGQEEPLYILEIDPERDLVVVGPKEALEQHCFYVSSPNWISPSLRDSLSKGLPFSFRSRVQMRHRHPGVLADIEIVPGALTKVSFVDEWSPVSPGQAAVFYDLENLEVLGGGKMERTRHLRVLSPQSREQTSHL
ncbi:MAG: tRNA 2-thiouridine(34) synthase MnmA [Bdellovibrionales bacterium]|nr:tRNA 2-thiouridine(34) synthase MnmA [Bdellovibrionales bacterium]